MKNLIKPLVVAASLVVFGSAAHADVDALGLTKGVKLSTSTAGVYNYTFVSTDTTAAFISALASVTVADLVAKFQSFQSSYSQLDVTRVKTDDSKTVLNFVISGNHFFFNGVTINPAAITPVVTIPLGSVTAVPGPVAGAGLPALIALLGSVFVARRRRVA